VHCRLFDSEKCTCTDYANRKEHVPDCIKLTPWNIEALQWMPKSCGYRRVNEGRGLANWHPLISGDPESVHTAGVSVRGQTISELDLADPDDAVELAAPEMGRRTRRLGRESGARWRTRRIGGANPQGGLGFAFFSSR
jgi:uncharacterized cysteine cluster protein YcgN (CxxCxxCC family)